VKKKLKWILCGAAVVAVLLQFTSPTRTNPPMIPGHDLLATNPPPAEIVSLLRQACYDCHSYETKWPWYGRIAPVSWWLAGHVKDGRKHLNFSEWPHDDPQRARTKWNRISNEVQSGDMPLPSYTWIHAQARLNPAQREQLVKWAEQEARRLESNSTETQGSVLIIDYY
jgi:hypothetical protein